MAEKKKHNKLFYKYRVTEVWGENSVRSAYNIGKIIISTEDYGDKVNQLIDKPDENVGLRCIGGYKAVRCNRPQVRY